MQVLSGPQEVYSFEAAIFQRTWHDTDAGYEGRLVRPVILRTPKQDGPMFFVEAIRVVEGEHGQMAWNPQWEDTLTNLYLTVEPDSSFATVNIEGHEGDWVLFVYPSAA